MSGISKTEQKIADIRKRMLKIMMERVADLTKKMSDRKEMFPGFRDAFEEDVAIFGLELFDYLISRRLCMDSHPHAYYVMATENSEFSQEVGKAVCVHLHDNREGFRTKLSQDFPQYVESDECFEKYFMNRSKEIRNAPGATFPESLLGVSAFLLELCKYCEERNYKSFMDLFPFYWWKMFLELFRDRIKGPDDWRNLRKFCVKKAVLYDLSDAEKIEPDGSRAFRATYFVPKDDPAVQTRRKKGSSSRKKCRPAQESFSKAVSRFPTVEEVTGDVIPVPNAGRREDTLETITVLFKKEEKSDGIRETIGKLYSLQRERVTNNFADLIRDAIRSFPCFPVQHYSVAFDKLTNLMTLNSSMNNTHLIDEERGSQGIGSLYDSERQEDEDISKEMEGLDINKAGTRRHFRRKKKKGSRRKK